MSCVDSDGIVKAFKDGKNLSEIARMFILTEDFVRKILNEANVDV